MKLLGTVLILSFPVVIYAAQQNLATSEPSLTKEEQQTVERLIGDLKSDDPRTLHEAFGQLGRLGVKASIAVDALAEMLDDDRGFTYPSGNIMGRTSFQVSISAVNALRNIGKPSVAALTTGLTNKNSTVRQHAAEAIIHIGQPLEPKHWIRALSDSNQSVRLIAAEQLGKLRDVSGVEALSKAMKGEQDVQARISIAKALGQTGHTAAIDPLIAALSDVNFMARVTAGGVLAKLGQPAVEALLGTFATLDEKARDTAANTFHESDPREMKNLMLQCLKSEYSQVREGALFAFITHKMPEAREACKEMVEDPNWHVRLTATRGLVQWLMKRPPQRFMILLKVLKEDKDPKVRTQSLESLCVLPGKVPKDFWEAIRNAMNDESPGVRKGAIEVACKFWDPRLAPKLMQLLKDPAPEVRGEAALGLGANHVEGVRPELIRLLDDKSPECAKEAAYALGNDGTDTAIEALIKTMQTPQIDQNVRFAALYVLRKSKSPKVVGALITALDDSVLRSYSQSALRDITGQNFKRAGDWRKWYERQGESEPSK